MNEGASTSTDSRNKADNRIVSVDERASISNIVAQELNEASTSVSGNEDDRVVSDVDKRASISTVVAVEKSSSDSNGIASVVGLKISDEIKYQMIKCRWEPPNDFQFPASTTRNLKFQRQWMKEYHWLVYSKSTDAAYCIFCAFFSPESAGGIKPKALVSQPFNTWKKAKEQFKYHESLDYHKRATVFAQSFIQVKEKKTVDIRLQLDTQKRAQIELNRKFLSSIIETIIFIGRQEISVRGHRDYGPLARGMPLNNDGNFRTLLRFRVAAGDMTLNNFFETSKQQYLAQRYKMI